MSNNDVEYVKSNYREGIKEWRENFYKAMKKEWNEVDNWEDFNRPTPRDGWNSLGSDRTLSATT